MFRWEQDVQRDLIPREDSARHFAEFLLEGLLRADTAACGEFYSKMFGIGAFSPNDILEKENMNGYEGGDERFMPLNMMPVGQQRNTSTTE